MSNSIFCFNKLICKNNIIAEFCRHRRYRQLLFETTKIVFIIHYYDRNKKGEKEKKWRENYLFYLQCAREVQQKFE